MTGHLGDSAALYALGILDKRDAADADEHVRSCDACRRLFECAQADVTVMVSAVSQTEPPALLRRRVTESLDAQTRVGLRRKPNPAAWLSIAAAVVLVIAPAAYLERANHAMHATMASDVQALARIASSPHRVAGFSGLDAEVTYGRDGSWYCIIVRGAARDVQVLWPHDGVATMLGNASTDGDVAMLYLPQSHPMDSLALVQNGKVVGQAHLDFH